MSDDKNILETESDYDTLRRKLLSDYFSSKAFKNTVKDKITQAIIAGRASVKIDHDGPEIENKDVFFDVSNDVIPKSFPVVDHVKPDLYDSMCLYFKK